MRYILLILLIVASIKPLSANDNWDDFLQQLDDNQVMADAYLVLYADIAVAEMERTGIPASIKLAQGMLESYFGRSDLAMNANNHFGIKCGTNWTGQTMYKQDDDPQPSCFRKYNSPENSFYDHSAFLLRDRYKELFSYPRTDYKSWANGLKRLGYATDPKYPEKLISTIEKYNLHRYDYGMQQPMAGGKPAPIAVPPGQNNAQLDNRIWYSVNGVPFVVARVDDNAERIAQRSGVNVKRIRQYNELDAHRIEAGQRVYLHFKKRRYKGNEKFHVVKAGDDMYSISQTYGMTLKHLYKKNRMLVGQEPAIGERISLKKKMKKTPRLRNNSDIGNVVPARPTEPTRPTEPARPTSTPPVTTQPTTPVSPPATGSSQKHVVQRGETLYSIAKKYGITVDELKRLNRLNSNEIKVGQELKIR